MTVSVQEQTDLKTCLITFVQPGQSDSVLKVFPARHEKEKIWLDNARGIERWEAVHRLLENHAERGTRVAKPVPYHSDPKNLGGRPDLKDENIPVVKLEGAVLEAPPSEERPNYMNQPAPNAMALSLEVKELKAQIASLAQALSNSQNKSLPIISIREVEPEVKAKDEADHCEKCNKKFKNWKGLALHNGKYHKKA